MFHLINKNIERETDKKLIISSKHTKLGIVLESSFCILAQVHRFSEYFCSQLATSFCLPI